MNAEETNNENFQNTHPAAPLEPVNTGLPTGASNTSTTTVQSTAHKPVEKKKPNVKQFEDDKTPHDKLLSSALDQEPASYKLVDFMSRPYFEKYSRHLTRVQDIVSKLGCKIRVPKIDRSFVPYVETVSYDGRVPNFGPDYSFTATTAHPNPLGDQNFNDPTFNAPRAANVANNDPRQDHWQAAERQTNISRSNRNLEVKWSSDVTQVLLTAISTNRWDWLKNGTRQNRAAAQATVTDITSLFTKDIDVAHGTLDTDLVAHWMYNYYVPEEEDEALLPQLNIININDLATFYNTSVTTIVSNKATLLNLSTDATNFTVWGDNALAKLVVLKPDDNVIINIGAPVENNAEFRGCPCRTIPCYQLVTPLDNHVGAILDQTLDEQTLEFSLFLNLWHLNTGIEPETTVTLTTYRADLQDSLIRYHSRPELALGVITNTTLRRSKVFWTYRVLKTILLQMAFKQYSAQVGVHITNTSGRVLDVPLFRAKFLGMFSSNTAVDPNNGGHHTNPVWIPFEFINNNAQPGWAITLDATNTTYGQRLAFANYKWPKSIICEEDVVNYVNINSEVEAPDIQVAMHSKYTWCVPLTMRYWRANNHISSVNPATYSHNNLLRVANTAWDETTYDNQATEEITF